MLFSPLFVGAMAILAIASVVYWIFIAVTEEEVPEELIEVTKGCGIIILILVTLIVILLLTTLGLGLYLDKL
jgi:hypothetical protein